MTGNGSYVKLQKLARKSLWVNLFSAGFSLLEPLCGGGAAAGATLSAGVACMDQAVNHCHSDGSSCSPVFTTATTTRLPPPPPQQPPVCPVEVKHDTH